MDFKKYENNVSYPQQPKKPTAPVLTLDTSKNMEQFAAYQVLVERYTKGHEAYVKARNEYHVNENALQEMFWDDAFENLGIDRKHSKSTLLRQMAWKHGHASGYSEVWYWLTELVELIR